MCTPYCDTEAMFINTDTCPFRFRTIVTSSSFAAALSEMPCERSWWIDPKIRAVYSIPRPGINLEQLC